MYNNENLDNSTCSNPTIGYWNEDADGLSTGVYFVRMDATSFINSKFDFDEIESVNYMS